MRRRSFAVPTAPLVIAALLAAGCGGGGAGTTAGPELVEGGKPPTTTTPVPAPATTQSTTSTATSTTTTPGTGTSTTAAPSGAATAAAGKAIFTSQGCSACHTLSAAGASGTVGPDLDKVLTGKDKAFITQSIVDPNAVIAKGYTAGIMPQNFGKTLSKQQLNQLVAFLAQATGG
jgi:mono/diheme cytochrome c family protein